MAEPRVALMVPEGIRDWIMDEIDRLVSAHERGMCECSAYNPDTKNPRAPKVSVAAFVEMLLEQRHRHRERRRKARRAASVRRKPPAVTLTEDGRCQVDGRGG